MPPPTRAKRAMEEAPKLKPSTCSNTPSVMPSLDAYRRVKTDMPMRPRPTTQKPITTPELNDTPSAARKLSVAA